MEQLIERVARKLINEFTLSPFEWANDKENVGDMQVTIGIVHGINVLADALKDELQSIEVVEHTSDGLFYSYGGTNNES